MGAGRGARGRSVCLWRRWRGCSPRTRPASRPDLACPFRTVFLVRRPLSVYFSSLISWCPVSLQSSFFRARARFFHSISLSSTCHLIFIVNVYWYITLASPPCSSCSTSPPVSLAISTYIVLAIHVYNAYTPLTSHTKSHRRNHLIPSEEPRPPGPLTHLALICNCAHQILTCMGRSHAGRFQRRRQPARR